MGREKMANCFFGKELKEEKLEKMEITDYTWSIVDQDLDLKVLSNVK